MSNKQKLYSLDDHFKELMNDHEFVAEWKKSEPEYLLAKQIIEKGIKKNISQRTLANRLRTSQAAISRIETMSGNPSLSFLKRIAEVFNTKLILKFE